MLDYSYLELNKMFNLDIRKRKINGVTILDLDGKIRSGLTSAFFGETLERLSKSEQNKILLNFSNVIEIDGSGLGEIIKSFNSVSKRGGKIKIVNLTKKVLQLMTISKILLIFEVFENELAAIASFNNGLIPLNNQPFVKEFHHEAEDNDLGLPEHPIYSNYSKYLWARHKKIGGVL